MSETCACSRVLCERIEEVEAHNASLKTLLDGKPYPSDLTCAEADRDQANQQLDQLLGAMEAHGNEWEETPDPRTEPLLRRVWEDDQKLYAAAQKVRAERGGGQ